MPTDSGRCLFFPFASRTNQKAPLFTFHPHTDLNLVDTLRTALTLFEHPIERKLERILVGYDLVRLYVNFDSEETCSESSYRGAYNLCSLCEVFAVLHDKERVMCEIGGCGVAFERERLEACVSTNEDHKSSPEIAEEAKGRYPIRCFGLALSKRRTGDKMASQPIDAPTSRLGFGRDGTIARTFVRC